MDTYSYPKHVRLKNGTELLMRPLRKEDEKVLHDYFLRLPSNEVARLKHDVTDPEIISKWIYDLDYDVVFPLVAIDNDRIVANGTLKFNMIGWRKHQGELRTTVDPEYRKQGVSTVLIENMIEIAKDMGLEQLTAEFSPTLDEAYFLFEKMGFKEAAVLKNFIKDQDGNYQDLVVMIMDLDNKDIVK
jgi:GNAT superfamily N-acetyltransferase